MFNLELPCSEHPIDSKDHPHRVSHYTEYERELNMNGITCPVSLKDYTRFERQNGPINVIEFFKGTNDFAPIYRSKIDTTNAVNIGLYVDHYVYIKNFTRLIGHSNQHKSNFCMNCFQNYKDPSHTTLCFQSKTTRVVMPTREKDKTVSFKSIKNMLMQPFVIYSDFE